MYHDRIYNVKFRKFGLEHEFYKKDGKFYTNHPQQNMNEYYEEVLVRFDRKTKLEKLLWK